MSRIFVSYAREDTPASADIADWLSNNGWADEVFIDTDPEHGISGGHAWRDALRSAAERCEAVLVLLSRSWLDSPVCWTEFRLAATFRKAIIPVKLEADMSFDDMPGEIKDWYQIIDRSLASDAEFYQRLRRALTEAGAGPASFPLQADAHPYPGLRSLKESDAALFFGRDPEVLQTIECIRQIRAMGQKRILVILGGSGTGKSSLLRAGIWPRINRDDRNYLALPTVRPGIAALSGDEAFWRSLALAMSDKRWATHLDPSMPTTSRGVAETVGTIGIVQVVEHFRRAAMKTLLQKGEQPSIVLPIDQAEELLNSDDQQEADQFLALVGSLLDADPHTILVLSLRSDMLAHLQADERIPQNEVQLFNLSPMPPSSLPQVISGPAERLGIEVEAGLVPRLLEDARGADALPLLALTLQNLYNERRHADRLTVDDYEHIGGVRKAIEETANRARAAAIEQGVAASDYSDILRQVFIPYLVRINEAEEPARRTALWSDFQTEKARTVVSSLVDQRLLVSDTHAQTRTVEIAHEAVLREWPEIVQHVGNHRDFLKWLDQVNDLRAAYAAKRGDLLAGRALVIALDFRDSFGDMLSPALLDYVNTSNAVAEKQRFAAVREAEAKARSARRTTRMFAGLTALLLIAAIGAGVATFQARDSARIAEQRQQDAESARKEAEIAEVMAQNAARDAQASEAAAQESQKRAQTALIRAQNEEQRALRETNRSESLRIAAIANDIHQREDTAAARLVAWMALPHDPALQDRPITNEAATALYQDPTRKIFKGLENVATVYAPDGSDLLATSLKDGRVRLFNVITELPVLDTQIRNWAGFETNYAYGNERLEDPETLIFTQRLPFPEFIADETHLILFHGDGTIDIHRRSDGARVRQVSYDNTISQVFLSSTGNRLLMQAIDSTLTVVHLFEDTPPVVLVRTEQAEEESDFDVLNVTGLMDDPGLGDTVWLQESSFQGYPYYSFFNKVTGVEGPGVSLGNTDVFAVGPSLPGRVFGCGTNNDAIVFNWQEYASEPQQSFNNVVLAGLYHFLEVENEMRLIDDGALAEHIDEDWFGSSDCAVSGDGTVAVVNSFERIALYDMRTGEPNDVTGRYSPFVTTSQISNYASFARRSTSRHGPVGISHDGSVIYGITGSVQRKEGELVFHDVATGQLLSRIETRHGINAYDVDRTASTAAILSWDGTVSIWDVISGARLFTFQTETLDEETGGYREFYINLDPSGRSVTISYDDFVNPEDSFQIERQRTEHIYRIRPSDATPIRADTAFRVTHVLGSDGGIVLGTAKGELQRRATNGRVITTYPAHKKAVAFLEAGTNGNLISAGWDGRLVSVNAMTLEENASSEAHPLGISALDVAPDKSRIATASFAGQVALWDSALQGPPTRFVTGSAAVSDVVFIHDSRHIVTGDADGVIKLWNVETGTELATLDQFDAPVWAMARIPGQNVVVATGGYGTTRAWSVTEGSAEPIWTLATNDRVRSMATTPDGVVLALGLSDGRVLLMPNPDRANAAEQSNYIELTGHRGPIVSMIFLGDGTLFATGSADRTTRIWDVETARQIAMYDGAGSTLLSVDAGTSGVIAATLFSENLVEARRLSTSSLRDKIGVFNEIAATGQVIPRDICNQYQLWSFPLASKVCATSD
ncbi:nSTAND1 domain-containing NTPase [Ruegeria atlantica]|uniref:nSTAND1 domain-containing NTPase n=1 Tax=Ruegeria atlantica TaxID=81569 RepID=UPI0014813B67|nr:TIR domain-containing protein [Ruegeria atlantica]